MPYFSDDIIEEMCIRDRSADNSLKALTISPGTLSPAFKGSTTKYTATVDNSVTSIAVSATPVSYTHLLVINLKSVSKPQILCKESVSLSRV